VVQLLLSVVNGETSGQLLGKLGAVEDLPGGPDVAVLLSQIALQLKEPGARAGPRRPRARPLPRIRGRVRVARPPARDLGAQGPARAQADFERALKLEPGNKVLRLGLCRGARGSRQRGGRRRASSARASRTTKCWSARAAYAARANDNAELKAAYAALKALPPPRDDARLELLGQLGELTGAKKEAMGFYKEVARGERWLSSQLRVAVLMDDLGEHDGSARQAQGAARRGHRRRRETR
jgi:hypothetical protein